MYHCSLIYPHCMGSVASNILQNFQYQLGIAVTHGFIAAGVYPRCLEPFLHSFLIVVAQPTAYLLFVSWCDKGSES